MLHSEICGSICACHSPQLIAAYRVLLRLPMPRHSPCALISLTIFYSVLNYALSRLKNFYCSISYLRIFLCVVVILVFLIAFAFLLYSIFKVLKRPLVVYEFCFPHCRSGFCFAKPQNSGFELTLWFSSEAFELSAKDSCLLLLFSCFWWAQVDSNHRPHAYQACALTT